MRVNLGPWQRIGEASIDGDGRLSLPRPPAGPGLYRFFLTGRERSVYIGESDDLRRRLYQYCHPGPSQRTNIRMNQRMRDIVAGGGGVIVEVCVSVDVEVRDCRERLDLRVKSHRLLAEEEALRDGRALGFDAVENAGGSGALMGDGRPRVASWV